MKNGKSGELTESFRIDWRRYKHKLKVAIFENHAVAIKIFNVYEKFKHFKDINAITLFFTCFAMKINDHFMLIFAS